MISILLTTVMVGTMIGGCGVSTDTGNGGSSGGGAESESAEAGTTKTEDVAATGDEVEITWMFWDDLDATEDLVTKGYKDVIDRFNEQYKGQYHVNTVTTNLEEYDTKLNALVAAGKHTGCVHL